MYSTSFCIISGRLTIQKESIILNILICKIKKYL